MPTIRCILAGGAVEEFSAPAGISLMQAAKEHGIDIEAACEGSLACATCHVALEEGWYERIDQPSDDEESMLDILAFLTPTSRLSCQIKLTDTMDGLTFKVFE